MFVLEFINNTEDIKASLQLYYEEKGLEEVIYPNILYDLQEGVEPYQIFIEEEAKTVNKLDGDKRWIQKVNEGTKRTQCIN
ncbi:TPA: hypothetical protein QCX06_004185 [Bacillus paranthracis]|uniref:hypothetical protein n=1 Tax=Bacillus paranthracis TaxID=2026186 RepID=UPI00298C5E5C|nr:hypothetical protein [Bacillus paranthracis]HDR7276603.1 hypothetical protein [Bacillus paranthracis]HDR7306533.1 hypothetical protein [Bacillus paranthracis]